MDIDYCECLIGEGNSTSSHLSQGTGNPPWSAQTPESRSGLMPYSGLEYGTFNPAPREVKALNVSNCPEV